MGRIASAPSRSTARSNCGDTQPSVTALPARVNDACTVPPIRILGLVPADSQCAAILRPRGYAPAPRVSVIDRLSLRELKVALAAAGASPRQIAERLLLGPWTVELSWRSVVIKLGLDATRSWRRSWRTRPLESRAVGALDHLNPRPYSRPASSRGTGSRSSGYIRRRLAA